MVHVPIFIAVLHLEENLVIDALLEEDQEVFDHFWHNVAALVLPLKLHVLAGVTYQKSQQELQY